MPAMGSSLPMLILLLLLVLVGVSKIASRGRELTLKKFFVATTLLLLFIHKYLQPHAILQLPHLLLLLYVTHHLVTRTHTLLLLIIIISIVIITNYKQEKKLLKNPGVFL